MIYEIGWSTFDIKYIVSLLLFFPFLFLFIVFQKRYNASSENEGDFIYRGSKSHIKVMISFLIIAVMFLSIASGFTLALKYKAIKEYKNGEYSVTTGTVQTPSGGEIYLSNDGQGKWFSIRETKINASKGETYTIYYTSSERVVRVDKN